MEQHELAAKFRKFGLVHSEGSPLYRAITLAVSESPDVIDLAMEIPLAQRVPNLLLAATQVGGSSASATSHDGRYIH